ncbi:hypothetical protein GCK72_007799 [Caenorhabditis remanei]|uniref:Uncharacterized protein n=1 Tax=Caenorhabditis remanei TaxID=31234 RepID=A0A6A5HI67_CAERE|nr:hypothetical protein GCK72_007799 [Caenorhabditis remanei]KAF1767840.1 hypothetical protein GCK72_007799 [Caenorhabditis remanei]
MTNFKRTKRSNTFDCNKDGFSGNVVLSSSVVHDELMATDLRVDAPEMASSPLINSENVVLASSSNGVEAPEMASSPLISTENVLLVSSSCLMDAPSSDDSAESVNVSPNREENLFLIDDSAKSQSNDEKMISFSDYAKLSRQMEKLKKENRKLRRLIPRETPSSSRLEGAVEIAVRAFDKLKLKEFSNLKNCESRNARLKALVKISQLIAGETNLNSFYVSFARFSRSNNFPWSQSITAEESLHLKTYLNMSDRSYGRLKRAMKTYTSFDTLAPLAKVRKAGDDMGVVNEYEIERKENNTAEITIKNVQMSLNKRCQNLFNAGVLDNTNTPINLTIMGDKGGKSTKVVIAIGEGKNTNSPDNLLILKMYYGDDKYAELREKLEDVGEQLSRLKTISYTDNNGTVIEKEIVFFLTGDVMFLCACFGHTGPSSTYPCVICYYSKSSCNGLLKMGEWDINDVCNMRNYELDSQNGSFNVKQGWKPIFPFIKPQYIIPPLLHIIMGISDKFIYRNLVKMASIADSFTPEEVDVLMKSMKRTSAINSLNDKVNLEQEWLDSYARDIRNVETIRNTWNSIYTSKVFRTSTDKCDANFCIFKELVSNGYNNVPYMCKCSSCGLELHAECCGIIKDSQKAMISANSHSVVCYKCNGFTKVSHIRKIVESHYSELSILHQKQLAYVEKLKSSLESVSSNLPPSGPCATAFEDVLYKDLKLIRKSYHGGCFNGNDTYKMYRPENIDKILKVFENTPNLQFSEYKKEIESLRKMMKHLGSIMSYSSTQNLTSAQQLDLSITLQSFLIELRTAYPDMTVTPKLHILASHVIPFIEKFGVWGKTSEQSIEHFHRLLARLERQFEQVPDIITRYKCILLSHSLENLRHDTLFKS